MPKTGKTAMVDRFSRELLQTNAFYIAGKFNQRQREMPYASFVRAFSSLVRQMLTESKEQAEEWRRRFKQAVGWNGEALHYLQGRAGAARRQAAGCGCP